MDEYERHHLKNLKAQEKTLLQLYQEAIDRIMIYANGLQLVNGVFNIGNYPLLSQVIDREVNQLVQQVNVQLVNGIRGSWELSQTKFGAVVSNRYYRSETMPDPIRRIVYNPQEKALEQFLARVNGNNRLGLSQRVFKYAASQFRAEIEQGLFVGISEGKSAAEMAREQKQYLQDQDKLFRRVRDAKGKLQLSKAAKTYNPGQGVYRSSYKNALRLTVQETNMAYRRADVIRWRNTPFVRGYEIRLSPSHPTNNESIRCDLLQGVYPVTFNWVAWHVRCLCVITPVLPDMAEFKEYQKALLEGRGDTFKFSQTVTDVPEEFKNYTASNMEMFSRWKSMPWWVRDNERFIPVSVV